MILFLNTSTPICELAFTFDNSSKKQYTWQADRTLAKNLLTFLKEKLDENNLNWADISAIGVFKGPGSFTGLRIGITVMNTIADAQNIPIVGVSGENWQNDALEKINSGQNEKIVMPFYGGDAHISTPKR